MQAQQQKQQQTEINETIKNDCTNPIPLRKKRLPMTGYNVVLVGPSHVTQPLARAMLEACEKTSTTTTTTTKSETAMSHKSTSAANKTRFDDDGIKGNSIDNRTLPLAIASLEATLRNKTRGGRRGSSMHRHHVHLVEHCKDLNQSFFCTTALDHIVVLFNSAIVLQDNLSCLSVVDVLQQRVTLLQWRSRNEIIMPGGSSESKAIRRLLQKAHCPVMFTLEHHDHYHQHDAAVAAATSPLHADSHDSPCSPATSNSHAVVAQILWKRTKMGARAASFHTKATTTTVASPLLFARQSHT